ncbi:hypothetical protein LZ31DRAFT_27985 [Colletotrichum somersetense]|nr:hypothetical protein LZ31DRAFT_27985 [Colletotrichum somersetense]
MTCRRLGTLAISALPDLCTFQCSIKAAFSPPGISIHDATSDSAPMGHGQRIPRLWPSRHSHSSKILHTHTRTQAYAHSARTAYFLHRRFPSSFPARTSSCSSINLALFLASPPRFLSLVPRLSPSWPSVTWDGTVKTINRDLRKRSCTRK